MIPWLRLLPYGAGLVVGAILLGVIYHRGYVAGSAKVQARFTEYVSLSDAALSRAQAEAASRENAARENNAKVITDYERRLTDSRVYSSGLASRLREYIAKANSSPVSENPDQPGTIGPGAPGGIEQITVVIGDAFGECRANAAQLDALIAEIRPQL
jgi:hypothetical protein